MRSTEHMASKIRKETGQKRPFASPEQEGVISLLRTADDLRRFFNRVVEPYGLTIQQFNVLRILRGAGEPGLPTMEIRRRMIEQTPGITRLLDRLVERKWVERTPVPEDRRCVICRITSSGLGLLQQIDPTMDAADKKALAALTGHEIGALVDALDRVREALRS